ncbi:hypothetical protein MMC20_002410 [Loxospora ochrophaea]|nr:hypothetical protein [Loxospora ochrophaea]
MSYYNDTFVNSTFLYPPSGPPGPSPITYRWRDGVNVSWTSNYSSTPDLAIECYNLDPPQDESGTALCSLGVPINAPVSHPSFINLSTPLVNLMNGSIDTLNVLTCNFFLTPNYTGSVDLPDSDTDENDFSDFPSTGNVSGTFLVDFNNNITEPTTYGFVPSISSTSTSSSATSTSTPSTATAFPATSSSSPASPTPTPSSGLSSGAKAGIGVGVAIGGLLLLAAAIAWLVFRRRRAYERAPMDDRQPPMQNVRPATAKELPGMDPPNELQASGGWHELDGVFGKRESDGTHELQGSPPLGGQSP